MEEKFGRLLFIVAFCQFHTYTCDLLALKSELDALAKCYEETTPSFFHTFVPNTTTTKKKKALCLLGYKETPLIWFEAPVAPVVTLVLECAEEVLVNVSSPWAYTLTESSSVQSHAWWMGLETSL